MSKVKGHLLLSLRIFNAHKVFLTIVCKSRSRYWRRLPVQSIRSLRPIDDLKGMNLVLKRLAYLSLIAAMLCAASAIAQDKNAFTADRHKSRGLSCDACHGEAQPKSAAPAKSCLNCHQSLKVVAEKTKDRRYNPHENHLTASNDIECTQCHNGHKADTPACWQCHEGLTFKKEPEEAK